MLTFQSHPCSLQVKGLTCHYHLLAEKNRMPNSLENDFASSFNKRPLTGTFCPLHCLTHCIKHSLNIGCLPLLFHFLPLLDDVATILIFILQNRRPRG